MQIRLAALAAFSFALGLFVLGLGGKALHGQVSLTSRGEPAVELVMFEQTACEWCEVWDEQVGIVYHKTKEGRYAPLRRLNIYAALPGDLRLVSPVTYTPTFVLTEKGVEIGRITGYPGEDFFWGMLDQLLNKLAANDSSRT